MENGKAIQAASEKNRAPVILAPAGNRAAFLAALAAGADAVYCGLKQFSARSEAKNFSIEELVPLRRLALEKGAQVYVAFNSLIRPEEMSAAGRMIEQLERQVGPDALIFQDLCAAQLARQAGFSGRMHVSTLANVSFPAALSLMREKLAVDRVVVPRELNIDEIKAMNSACPEGLELEVFVHGALCYGVSGRCYWSSFLGGKSGLRGSCVQPCRRIYFQDDKREKYFSCQDLSLDVLVKVLLPLSRIRAWKIEGRKKSPHYVFYTVQAYRMLRDEGRDPKIKKAAVELLGRALGRTGTHYNFLPQRPQNPVDVRVQTGSGMFVGNVKGPKEKPFVVALEALLPGDVLRIGYEDQAWHTVLRVNRYVPRRGRLFLKTGPRNRPAKDTPVFLTDRREKTLKDLLAGLESKLGNPPKPSGVMPDFKVRLPKRFQRRMRAAEVRVYRALKGGKLPGWTGLWLSEEALSKQQAGLTPKLWWWLPPVIWPEDEPGVSALIEGVLKKGARRFVLNAPWQAALFARQRGLNLWAGPFCNVANPLAVDALKALGFSGAVVSPELGEKDYLQLPRNSPLPLGIVLSGRWPLCVSRVVSPELQSGQSFKSPRGESAWVEKRGADFWVFPNWELDIRNKLNLLEKAGFRMFFHLIEPLPEGVRLKKRPGLWNWGLDLR